MNCYNSPDNMHLGASKEVFEKAKMLRSNRTPQEEALWCRLKFFRKVGFHFRQQHPIGFYVADFYCHRLRLVIEIDGKNHETTRVKALDQEKEDFLVSNNIKVIRFTNDQIDRSIEEVVKEIDFFIKQWFDRADGTL